MIKSFLSRSKSLLSDNTSYPISRRFAVQMLPLSFLAGIFICIAIPASFYYLERVDAVKQSKMYADDIAVSFKQLLEADPLNWQEELNAKFLASSIGCVEIFDRNMNPVAQMASCDTYRTAWFPVREEKQVLSGTGTYAIVLVYIDMTATERQSLILLLVSLCCGTMVGLTLFLWPVFQVQDVEDEMNSSYRKLENEQKKLKISEEQFKTFFEFAPDATVLATESGRILSANFSFREMFQCKKDEIDSMNAEHSYVHSDQRGKLLEILFEVGEVRNEEVMLYKKDGTKMSVLISMNLIRAGVMGGDDMLKEETVLILSVIKDISEKKKVEKQLIQAQKMESIGMLAGGVAHDFNNLLTGIMGYADLIEIETDKGGDINGYAKVIKKTAARGSELSGKLLAFARGGKYLLEEIDLNSTAREVLSILKHTIDKKISIVREFDQDLHIVKADAGQLNQVLLNLCVNARDAMVDVEKCILSVGTYNTHLEEKRFVTGDISLSGDYSVVSVEDTGSGIDEDFFRKIFDPFFSTKKKGEGTGLGLSMVYGIVRSHEGYIDVVSEPGKGSVFSIYLPSVIKQKSVATADDKEENEELSRLPGWGETILLIEDEEIIRNFCKVLLERVGYHVLEAEDGVAGVAAYKEHGKSIDLVLLDMILPNKNGPDVFYEIGEVDPDAKFILASGYCIDSKSQKLLDDGAITFVQKPYEVKKLLAVIRAALSS